MIDSLADAMRKLEIMLEMHDTRRIHSLAKYAIIDLKLAAIQHDGRPLPASVSLPDRGIAIKFPIHQSQTRKAN